MSNHVGQQLRQAREARSLTLEEISMDTHIRIHHLRAMEAGEFGSIPSVTQARGFLRAYGSYLGLEVAPLLADLESEAPAAHHATAPGSQDAQLINADANQVQPSQPTSDPDTDPGKAYFIEVGQMLRHQRELLGLSLEDVERHTHLRLHYLLALEAGDMEALPSPVQGRGMLSNYAGFLGMDQDTVMIKFAEGLQAQLAVRQAIRPQTKRTSATQSEIRPPSTLRRLFSGDFIVGIALASFLLVFVAWGSIRVFNMTNEQTPTPTAPSIADVLLASPTPTEPLTTLAATESEASSDSFPPVLFSTDEASGLPLPPRTEGKVQVYVTIQQRAYLRVVVDGEVEFEGRVIPGSAYPFIGESQIEILTGNGAAVLVYFNEQNMGNLGSYGEVVNLVFTLEGVFLPTPTITPTPTASPPVTPTPPATATPVAGQSTPPANP